MTIFMQDRHTTEHVIPVNDTSQDWVLLRGEESQGWTTLRFIRKLDTCDPEDRVIDVSIVH